MAQPALMSPPARREIGADVYSEKLGIWIFLGSEVMFFTALIGSYIILRFGSPEQWSAPGAILNVPLTAVNTFLLICSSVTMVKAFAAIQDGDQKGLRLYLVATVIIGAAFVGVQAYEYIHLVAEGFLPSGYGAGSHLAAEAAEGNLPVSIGVYGSSFYTMTGFHGFHVSVGVIAMSFVTWKAFRGDYTKEDHRGVEVVGLYWHFVDLPGFSLSTNQSITKEIHFYHQPSLNP